MDTDLLNNSAGDNTQNNTKKRKRKIKKAKEKHGPQNMDQMGVSGKGNDCEVVANNGSEKNLFETDIAVTSLAEHPKMDVESMNNLSEVNTDSKKKKKKKKKKKAKVKEDIQSTDQPKIDTGSTKDVAEGNISVKRKRKRRKKIKRKVNNTDETKNMEQMNNILNLHLSDENHVQVIDGKHTENVGIAEVSELSVRKESLLSDLHDKENPLDSSKNEETVLYSDMVEVSSKRVSCELVEERPGTLARPLELEGEFKFENDFNDVKTEMVVDQEKCSAEGSVVISTCVDEVTTQLSSSAVIEAECLSMDLEQCPRIAPTVFVKRKLLVLDVNGLLAYIVMPAPKDRRGDVHILGRAIFKRPFCDDFLKFCFQNFDVGIWSSRSKRIIDKVVDYLLGELRDKVLFCWDMEHSTQTGFKTLENIHKPLVCKELRKIWENDNPDFPWKKGDYDESNTLLLDDSPYKALLNPLHTAIFPQSYHYEDKNDNSLGPGGDLRVYLEGLLESENVQKYVEQHPFGQSAINETSLSWEFYSGVLQTLWNRLADNTTNTLPTLELETSTCQ